MAEDYVSQDQHRADMAELRLEQTNALASLDKRTELIAQDLIAFRREVDDRFDRMNEQMTDRFSRMEEQMTDRFSRMEEQMTDRFDRVADRFDRVADRFDRMEEQISDLRQDMRHLQTAVQRQMWALIAVVAGGVIKVLFFP